LSAWSDPFRGVRGSDGARHQEWKKKGRILKIILYGSYARGGWVDEPHTAKGYQSDFDLLIIVSDKRPRRPGAVLGEGRGAA
jgi:predicted nucleotidyltransferase